MDFGIKKGVFACQDVHFVQTRWTSGPNGMFVGGSFDTVQNLCGHDSDGNRQKALDSLKSLIKADCDDAPYQMKASTCDPQGKVEYQQYWYLKLF